MKSRHLSAFCACLLSLSISSAVSAAFYDFEQWVQDNGAQGFDNSNPFKLTVDGLRLKAKAFSKSQESTHVYLDNLLTGSSAGMGVCVELDVNYQCVSNSSVERQDRERLRWKFNENISSITLEFDNDINGFNSRKFQYKYNSDPWVTATADASSLVTLNFDGSSDKIQFRTKGKNIKNQFYILNANVTAVPLPAAVWLFTSGLLGLLVISRRS
jgi:hypothetical protein